MTVYNSITKLSRRNVSDLEGINIINLESSASAESVEGIVSVTYVDKSKNNTMSKLATKTFTQLSGLLVSIVECSVKNFTITLPFKFIYPKKSYGSILKLYREYIIKLKG